MVTDVPQDSVGGLRLYSTSESGGGGDLGNLKVCFKLLSSNFAQGSTLENIFPGGVL